MFDRQTSFLVVDDFATMRRIVKDVLKQLGYEQITEAEDGAKAYSKLLNGEYDFVVTDWNMPNMDGLELLKKIRGDGRLKALPVLMVTAENEKERVIMAIQAGVSNYIVKPFTAEMLESKLQMIFDKLYKTP